MPNRVSNGVYAIAIVILAGYFVWLVLHMANYSTGGDLRLEKLAAGLGLVIVVPTLLFGVLSLLGRGHHE